MKPEKCNDCVIDARSCPYAGKWSECPGPVEPYGGALVCFAYGEGEENVT